MGDPLNPVVCKICGSPEIAVVYQSAQDYITGQVFQIWQCKNCQAAWTQPRPENMAPYYPQKYRRYHPLVGKVLQQFYRRRVLDWSRQFSQAGLALEIGCGDGLMLSMLRDLGWQVIGSERTPDAAHFARQELDVPVFIGDVDALHPQQGFDLIILFQVLEHLDNPRAVLQKIAAHLKPGGKLIVGVPNFGSWQSRLTRERWFHLDPPRHLFHYSLPALRALCMQYDLHICQVSYFSPEHDPFGWVQSWLNRIDRKNNRLTRLLMGIDPVDPSNLLHLALGGVLGVVSLPLAAISWLAEQGAMIEVMVEKKMPVQLPREHSLTTREV